MTAEHHSSANFSNIRLGSHYGGWCLPKKFLVKGISTAICIGSGEDISYDLILSSFSKKVLIIDPTPKAITHFSESFVKLSCGINAYSKPDHLLYNKLPHNLSNIIFLPVGVHEANGLIDFFPPPKPEYASYSTENIQNTSNPIRLPVIDPQTLLAYSGTNSPDILKLDIEGAEVPFLNSLITSKLRPKILQVELDTILAGNIKTASELIDKLLAEGYSTIHIEDRNYVFYYQY